MLQVNYFRAVNEAGYLEFALESLKNFGAQVQHSYLHSSFLSFVFNISFAYFSLKAGSSFFWQYQS